MTVTHLDTFGGDDEQGHVTIADVADRSKLCFNNRFSKDKNIVETTTQDKTTTWKLSSLKTPKFRDETQPELNFGKRNEHYSYPSRNENWLEMEMETRETQTTNETRRSERERKKSLKEEETSRSVQVINGIEKSRQRGSEWIQERGGERDSFQKERERGRRMMKEKERRIRIQVKEKQEE